MVCLLFSKTIFANPTLEKWFCVPGLTFGPLIVINKDASGQGAKNKIL